MNLENIMLMRAEEQMQSSTWRYQEAAESEGPKLCPRCQKPITRSGAGVCRECRLEGYRPAPCVTCGRPFTHKRDRARRRKPGSRGGSYLYGMCAECRRSARGDEP